MNAVVLATPQSLEATLVQSVTDKEVSAIITSIDHMKIDDALRTQILAIKSDVEFQGFDVKTTLRALSAVFSSKYSKDVSAFGSDLIFLLVTFINRGVITQKTLNRMKKEAAERYNGIALKFGIQVSQKSLAPHVLTLPRICQAFPILSTKISIIVGGKDYNGPFMSRSFPAAIKNAAFAALIPQGVKKIKDVLAIIFTCYTADQAYTFATNKPKVKELKKVFYDQLKFTNMAIEGSIVEEKRRVAAMKTFEIDTHLKYLPSYVTHLNEVFNIEAPELLKENEAQKMFASISMQLKDGEENPFMKLFVDKAESDSEVEPETPEEAKKREKREKAARKKAAAEKDLKGKKPEKGNKGSDDEPV